MLDWFGIFYGIVGMSWPFSLFLIIMHRYDSQKVIKDPMILDIHNDKRVNFRVLL